ncbi:MAG: hypothetical protein UU32_C0025G0008 [Candidatus Woesebacteria bacterium GW2011_GWB1_41_10]|uniref:Glycosyltransferase RgtA/B/C/D-like domain-containing protein n=1 Tax=Candidatus Woesebacteria bacterium GW2011_GWB1_41_10 TaxID=1618577 RepID=A0A0G0WNG0_9BACT|nr:MAG: hypothetical protein UU32_C0025G0008 [Candidatus Woesebacteria bacterium GW2011_GWB1_41_10]
MRKIWKEWGWTVLSGLGIIVVGLVIRLINLTILPVFADEAIYIRWSQIMINEPTLRFLPMSDGKQPLFMWVLMFLVNRFSDPLFIGRLVSVISGLGTMIGLFLLTYILFKNKVVSLATTAIWAISPYSVFFDRMALVDSMLTMFGVWSVTFGIITAKTLRLDYAMITGFFLGGALLTKSPAIFFVILLPAALIFAKQKIKVVLLFIVTLVIAFGMYNILRLGPNFHLLTSRTADYVFPISHLWENPKDPFIPYFDRAIEWLRMMGPWPVLALVLFGIVAGLKKLRREILFLFSWWLIPTLIQSEFGKVFTARYELFTLSFLFGIAAAAFLVTNKILKWTTTLVFVLFIIFSGIFNYKLLTNPDSANLPRSEKSGYLEEWTAGQGIREIADYLKNGGRVVVGTEGYFGTLPDGLQMYLANYPEITVIGVGIDIKELPKSLAESKEAGNKTYLVVNKSRLLANPEKLGLTLIAEYPKVPRPIDVREYVTKGPQEFLYFFELK